LTDSDKKGYEYKGSLIDAAVDEKRIFMLQDGDTRDLTVEDFIHKDTYVTVVNDLLAKLRDYAGDPLEADSLPDSGIANASEVWTKKAGYEPLPKTKVAEHLLRVCHASLAYDSWDPANREPLQLIRSERRASTRKLFGNLRSALQVEDE
jgi:hypothetical protein